MKVRCLITLLVSILLFCSCNINGQTPKQKQIDSLVNVLINERWEWNEASDKLIQIGEPAVQELIEVLQDKSIDTWPRRKVAMTLAPIQSEKKIDPCIEIFTDHTEDNHVRINACNALASEEIGKYEKLFFQYALDKNEGIRMAAYGRLAQIGSEKAVNFLVNELDGQIEIAQWGLLRLLAPIESEKVNEKFINALGDSTWWMTNEFIRDVLIKKGEEVLQPLNGIYENRNNSDYLRWMAIWIIKDLETDKKTPILLQALKDKSWLIRNEAEVALNK